MVDAHITYPDGTVAALEVVGDKDKAREGLQARLEREGQSIEAPTLRHKWVLTLAEHAKIREIRRDIVPLLELIESDLPGDIEWPRGRRWKIREELEHAFNGLGVIFAIPSPYGQPRVELQPRRLWEFAGDPNSLSVWVQTFLTDTAADVPAKLAASGLTERHVFIWATVSTPYEVGWTLEKDQPLPTVSPALPGAITHVWVGSYFARHRMLAWDQGSGWREAYRIPDDGVIPF
jgi:hypothetical protein